MTPAVTVVATLQPLAPPDSFDPPVADPPDEVRPPRYCNCGHTGGPTPPHPPSTARHHPGPAAPCAGSNGAASAPPRRGARSLASSLGYGRRRRDDARGLEVSLGSLGQD